MYIAYTCEHEPQVHFEIHSYSKVKCNEAESYVTQALQDVLTQL